MKKKISFILIIFVLLIGLIGGMIFLRKLKDKFNTINDDLIATKEELSLVNSELENLKYSEYDYYLPDYYEEHLNSKITKINLEEMDSGKNGATYCFITDMHTLINPLNSLPLLERIRVSTNANHCFYGGDSVPAYGDETSIRLSNESIKTGLYHIWGNDLSYILGNHDYIICNGEQWGENMKEVPKDAVYGIYNQRTQVDTDKFYYYWDDSLNEIRHIIIDYQEVNNIEFLKWFELAIENAPNGYKFCFYTHVNMFNADGEMNTVGVDYTHIINMICAIKNKTTYSSVVGDKSSTYEINVDYTNTDKDVIYVMYGHDHTDFSTQYNNVNFICTTSDTPYQDDSNTKREIGTYTEQAFDVIHINMNTHTIYLTRIGAGKDREFTY